MNSSSIPNLLHLPVFSASLSDIIYHLLAQARCQGIIPDSSLPHLLLTQTPLFCIHCVLLNWRRTEDEGYGHRQVVKSVWPWSLKNEVENSYQQIKDSKNIPGRWPTLYSSHPIYLLLCSFIFSPHHTWITAIVIPWNSLYSFSSPLTQILHDTQNFLIKHCSFH